MIDASFTPVLRRFDFNQLKAMSINLARMRPQRPMGFLKTSSGINWETHPTQLGRVGRGFRVGLRPTYSPPAYKKSNRPTAPESEKKACLPKIPYDINLKCLV